MIEQISALATSNPWVIVIVLAITIWVPLRYVSRQANDASRWLSKPAAYTAKELSLAIKRPSYAIAYLGKVAILTIAYGLPALLMMPLMTNILLADITSWSWADFLRWFLPIFLASFLFASAGHCLFQAYDFCTELKRRIARRGDDLDLEDGE